MKIHTKIRKKKNVSKYIFNYLNGFEDDGGIYDLDYEDKIIGKKYFENHKLGLNIAF